LNHSKTGRLARALQIQRWGAIGLMESLWHLTDREAPQGNIGKLTDDDIAHALDWRKEPKLLIDAYVAAGLLDTSDEHRLIVHDWPEHCQDAVHARLARSGMYFADGKAPNLRKLNQKERSEAEARYAAQALAAAGSSRKALAAAGSSRQQPKGAGRRWQQPTVPSPTKPDPAHLSAAGAADEKPDPFSGGSTDNGDGRTDGNESEPAHSFDPKLAADVYLGFHPRATVPPAMFRALKPLVSKHGWDAVRLELEAYLAATEVQFHNWAKFPNGFGSWSKAGTTALAKRGNVQAFPTKNEQTLAAAERELRRIGAIQ
jgi:hypothetical protein